MVIENVNHVTFEGGPFHWVSQDLSIFVCHSSALLENTFDLSYRFSEVIYECTRWDFTTWPLA